MNECYAVDPAAPADARELKLLLDQFGLQTGRFVARYPQGWPHDVIERLNRLSEMERKRAVDLLQRRHGCMIPVPRAPFQVDRAWANNAAVVAERDRVFNGVIGQRDNGFGWPSVEQVLYEDGASLPEGRGAHVTMRASTYAECARPLFLASAEVMLVDPYFTLRTKAGSRCRRRWPVMVAFLRAAEASGTCQSLRLVLERAQIDATERSETVLEADLESALIESGTQRIGLEYEVRETVGHGRYLLSIQGGLQFDQGFEEEASKKNHVHWLSRPELEPLLDRFAPPTVLSRP
jgi:hypothetical protein